MSEQEKDLDGRAAQPSRGKPAGARLLIFGKDVDAATIFDAIHAAKESQERPDSKSDQS